MSLYLIHRRGATVHPLPRAPQTDIDDGAISLGLTRMVQRIADPANPDGLVLDRHEVADIIAGLAPGATPQQRQTALRRLADNHADWTATPGGQTEMTALVTFLAPHCPSALWREVVEETAAADDPHADVYAVAAAEARLSAAVRQAVRLNDTVVPFPARPRHRAPDGPGAA